MLNRAVQAPFALLRSSAIGKSNSRSVCSIVHIKSLAAIELQTLLIETARISTMARFGQLPFMSTMGLE